MAFRYPTRLPSRDIHELGVKKTRVGLSSLDSPSFRYLLGIPLTSP